MTSRNTKLLNGSLVALVSMVVAFGAAELASRALLPEVSDTFIVELDTVTNRFHHGVFPALEPPRDEAYRILFLGDSFTLGLGIPDRNADAFPAVTGRMFRSGSVDGLPARDVQAFNLGMFSYSPSIYGAVLNRYAPLLRPHLVVIAVDDSDPQDDYMYASMVEDDADGLPMSVYPKLPGVPSLLIPVARLSKFVRLSLFQSHKFWHDVVLRRWRSEEDRYLGDIYFRYSHFKREDLHRWGSAFKRTLSVLDAMVRYCRRNQMDVLLVNYPYSAVVSGEINTRWRTRFDLDPHRTYEPVFHRLQRNFAMRRRIGYYDLTYYVRQLPSLDGFYVEDGHFSEVGHQHLARELVRVIEQEFHPGGATRQSR